MADTRRRPEQTSQQYDRTYDTRLHPVGQLWQTTSTTSGRPLLTGEVSLGVTGMPVPVVITENTREDRSERAPTHTIFIRVPRRGTGNAQSGDQSAEDLPF